MNEDFGLSLTPANVRRLFRLQLTGGMIIADDLKILAEQDVISKDDFDSFVCSYSETKRTITQFLLDCNLRGIVQRKHHPEFSEVAVLNTIRLAKPNSIVVFTQRREGWKNAAKAVFVDDITTVHSHYQLTGEEIDQYRSGVLIIECEQNIEIQLSKIRDFSLEFPRTILFEPFNSSIPWPLLAQTLFPTMPSPLYPRIVTSNREHREVPLHMFAPFYNVCLFPEHITDQTTLDEISDKRLHSNLQHYKHLMNIG